MRDDDISGMLQGLQSIGLTRKRVASILKVDITSVNGWAYGRNVKLVNRLRLRLLFEAVELNYKLIALEDEEIYEAVLSKNAILKPMLKSGRVPEPEPEPETPLAPTRYKLLSTWDLKGLEFYYRIEHEGHVDNGKAVSINGLRYPEIGLRLRAYETYSGVEEPKDLMEVVGSDELKALERAPLGRQRR
jgi:hypothetical protein